MGGTLAIYADRGVETTVVCCTDGKAATIFAPDMPEDSTRPRLAEIRREELLAACQVLGVSHVHHLGYGDSGMAGAESNDAPDSFWMARLDNVVAELVAVIRSVRPHVVVTYDAYGGYGHPDHIQTHRATLLAVEAAHHALYAERGPRWEVEKLYYTCFPRSQAQRAVDLARAAGRPGPFGTSSIADMDFVVPDERVTTIIDCSDGILRKRAALLAHHSQIQPDWPLVAMSEAEALEHFGSEYFILALSRHPPNLPESDLFAGIDPDPTQSDRLVAKFST